MSRSQPEGHAAYMKVWRKANPDKWRAIARRAHLKKKYGITPEQYTEMLEFQEGTCALCARTAAQSRYGVLRVDHDHTTKRVRGLLCDFCNRALGILGDNIVGLERVMTYLRRGGYE